MKRTGMLIVFFIILARIQAQEVVISINWDSFDDAMYEAALVLPSKRGEAAEVIKNQTKMSSKDRSVSSIPGLMNACSFEISKLKAGLYHIYMANLFADESLENALDNEWSTDLTVSININGRNHVFSPPVNKMGSVWYVASINGSDSTVQETNKFIMQKRFIYGQLTHAKTGLYLPDATVSLYHYKSGELIDKMQSNGAGFYFFTPPHGDFRIVFEKEGFISIEDRARFFIREFPQQINASLSDELQKLQYRIVLTWGQYPSDLDSHLAGPEENNTKRFHISYRNMRTYVDRHFLDVDDMSSYGPETITITRLDEGIYTYWVYDYSNGGSQSSDNLSLSEATVHIYGGKKLLHTVKVPENIKGTCWKVLEIDGKTGKMRLFEELNFGNSPQTIRE